MLAAGSLLGLCIKTFAFFFQRTALYDLEQLSNGFNHTGFVLQKGHVDVLLKRFGKSLTLQLNLEIEKWSRLTKAITA